MGGPHPVARDLPESSGDIDMAKFAKGNPGRPAGGRSTVRRTLDRLAGGS
jgi:hypothetical protein